jgi:hypothetical protein
MKIPQLDYLGPQGEDVKKYMIASMNIESQFDNNDIRNLFDF